MIRQVLTWPKPQVKERPRFANGRVYTPKKTQDAERALADQWTDDPAEGPITIDITFTNNEVVVIIEEAEDYENRKLRGDLDNYVKLVLDGLNKVAFEDDAQITTITARKL